MVEFLGVGVQHVPGALGRYRGKRCIRCRLAARRPVLAGACAEPAVLPVGIYSDLALRVRPVQGDAMLLQGGHSLLSGMPVSVVGPHTEKGTSGRRCLQQFLSGGRRTAVTPHHIHITGQVLPGGNHVLFCVLLSVAGQQAPEVAIFDAQAERIAISVAIILQPHHLDFRAAYGKGIPLGRVNHRDSLFCQQVLQGSIDVGTLPIRNFMKWRSQPPTTMATPRPSPKRC